MELLLIVGAGLFLLILLVTLFDVDGEVPLDRALKETGRLIGSEVRLNYRGGFSVSGRADQIWSVPNAGYVLVDTKRRARQEVYKSDRLQLSIYTWLMRRASKFHDQPIMETAFVRFPQADEPAVFLPVELFSDEETETFIRRAFVLSGKIPERNPSQCYRCKH